MTLSMAAECYQLTHILSDSIIMCIFYILNHLLRIHFDDAGENPRTAYNYTKRSCVHYLLCNGQKTEGVYIELSNTGAADLQVQVAQHKAGMTTRYVQQGCTGGNARSFLPPLAWPAVS